MRARGGSDIRDVNLNSENWAVVKAALVAGMYPNLVHLNQETSLLSSNREKKIHFHPTSVLSQSQFKEVEKQVFAHISIFKIITGEILTHFASAEQYPHRINNYNSQRSISVPLSSLIL